MNNPNKSTETDRDKDREALRDMLLEIVEESTPLMGLSVHRAESRLAFLRNRF